MGQRAGDRSGKSRLKSARSLWLLSRRFAAPVGVSLTTPRACHTAGIEPGNRHLNFQHYRDNIRCRRTSGTGAEIRQPEIAMLAHADKRTAAPSVQDLVNK
jgi:hypothetical protein